MQIAAIDPFGHKVTECYTEWLKKGWDVRPTIAVTKAHIDLPECREAITAGRLKPDGKILMDSGQSIVSKAAIEPVWYLPEIARRFETTESNLRQSIFRMTNGEFSFPHNPPQPPPSIADKAFFHSFHNFFLF